MDDAKADPPEKKEKKNKGVDDDNNHHPLESPERGARRVGRLVEAEERKAGAPAWKVFALYLQSAGWCFAVAAALYIAQQPVKYVQSLALTRWIAVMERDAKGTSPLANAEVWWYCGWTGVFVLITAVAIIFQNRGGMRASQVLHERLVLAVLRAPTAWYDRSPTGRIQNRFSTDLQAVDRNVANSVMFVIRGVVTPLVSLYSIGSSVPWLVPFFLPVLATAGSVANAYIAVARDLKRIDSTTKSPVYACFNESLNGLATLRAFDGAVDRFARKFAALVDRTNAAELHLFATNFWLSTRLNTLGATVAGLTSLVLYARPTLSPPVAGLVLSYAISFTSAMIMLLRNYTDLELALNSVERIQEYLDHPVEPPLDLATDPARWLLDRPPEVAFEAVTLRYASQAEPALNALSVTFAPGESVGVCGRTGAGKSTLLQSLLRLYPIQQGRVLVDGLDVASVGLRALRGRIAIVPQDPTIFSGTVRYNLDMFDERSDEELLQALEQSRGGDQCLSSSGGSLTNLARSSESTQSFGALTAASSSPEVGGATTEGGVAELALDFHVAEFGNNLSVGERQLLCLARAIARQSRLVLMDEATANVDQTTDRRIQHLLRTGPLSHATRITIAHRLATIVYCDKVAVLSRGQLAEFAAPSTLLADPDSAFHSMCDSGGNLPQLRANAAKADAERLLRASSS